MPQGRSIHNRSMRERIEEELDAVEAERGVRVLFACESGSRAWGFASVDSDYDVRFLYAMPTERYLTIRPMRDVIEAMRPDDIDLAGWDLRKALGLLVKANPSLFEWLASPIVYRQDERFFKEFRALADRWYSAERNYLHYLNMATGNWRAYLQDEEVSRKKYLYVLRPTLACRWIERGFGFVPMEFDHLREAVIEDREVASAIEGLLREKRAGVELAKRPPDPTLHAFLQAELERLAAIRPEPRPSLPTEELDEFFRRWIGLVST